MPRAKIDLHFTPVFNHTRTPPIVLTARSSMRLTPDAGFVECERRSNGLIHPLSTFMSTYDANGIEGVESEANNEFRLNDSDLWKRKFLSRPNKITHRYRTTYATFLYEREKIRGIEIF